MRENEKMGKKRGRISHVGAPEVMGVFEFY